MALPADPITQWDHQHSWHPFTPMQEYRELPPLHVAKGEGCWLYDTAGNRYLDGNASLWTNLHGHNDPTLNAALVAQLEQVAHSTFLGLNHPVGSRLARKLTELAPPSLNRVFFSDNGAGAVEAALKMSLQFWQLTGHPEKTRVLGMRGGYHGDTLGAMAAGDSERFHARFRPWFLPSSHFPAPRCHEFAGRIFDFDATESLSALRTLLEVEATRSACLILEPSVQGAAGMRLQPPGFVWQVAALCREFKVHLILDEVFVAFGRTGPLLVCTHENVQPDFLCLAKGLAAGYLPLAATLVREEIFSAFLGQPTSDRTFFHGHTFTGNPLAAAVALANLEKLEVMDRRGEIERTVRHFARLLGENFLSHPHVGQIRQRGLLAAIDLVPDRHSSTRFAPTERIAFHVCLRARRHGLLLRPLGDSILIVPPLVIREEEIDFLCRALASALDETLATVHAAN